MAGNSIKGSVNKGHINKTGDHFGSASQITFDPSMWALKSSQPPESKTR